jgi:hypothetical protein
MQVLDNIAHSSGQHILDNTLVGELYFIINNTLRRCALGADICGFSGSVTTTVSFKTSDFPLNSGGDKSSYYDEHR